MSLVVYDIAPPYKYIGVFVTDYRKTTVLPNQLAIMMLLLARLLKVIGPPQIPACDGSVGTPALTAPQDLFRCWELL